VAAPANTAAIGEQAEHVRFVHSSALVALLLAGGLILGACSTRVDGEKPTGPAEATPAAYSGDPLVTQRATRVSRLLARAAFAYEDAVAGSEVASAATYRRAVSLLDEARSAYAAIASDLEQVSPGAAAEVSSELAQVAEVLPARVPDTPIAAPADVAASAAAVARRLEVAVDARFPGVADPVPLLGEMGATLAVLSSAYREGDQEAALTALDELRHRQYRSLALDVAAVSPAVNARVADALAALQLRMEQKASNEEISDMVRDLSGLIAAAAASVEEVEFASQG
jgi:hypothetical protein